MMTFYYKAYRWQRGRVKIPGKTSDVINEREWPLTYFVPPNKKSNICTLFSSFVPYIDYLYAPNSKEEDEESSRVRQMIKVTREETSDTFHGGSISRLLRPCIDK